MYLIEFSSQAEKDKKLLKAAGLERKTKQLLDILLVNPFQTPPPYEKLVGNLRGNVSRRINIQHRLVYDVRDNIEGLSAPDGRLYDGVIRIKRMWSHYE